MERKEKSVFAKKKLLKYFGLVSISHPIYLASVYVIISVFGPTIGLNIVTELEKKIGSKWSENFEGKIKFVLPLQNFHRRP